MGIDVNLYAEGTPTEEQMEAAEALVRQRSYIASWGRPKDPALRFYHDLSERPRVEFLTLSRYFGPGYPRGHWPSIEIAIKAMQEAFPDWPVFYGGDTSDDCPQVDDEMLNECRAIWREVEADWA